jgi:hypothetical protein
MSKLWAAFVAVSSLGLAAMILMASVATEPVGASLFGPTVFFVGWMIVSGVVWFAIESAVSFLASRHPARSTTLSVAAALALGAGVQSLSFYLPYASASLTWEPDTAALAPLIQVFMFAGVALVTAGIVLTLVSMFSRLKTPRLAR